MLCRELIEVVKAGEWRQNGIDRHDHPIEPLSIYKYHSGAPKRDPAVIQARGTVLSGYDVVAKPFDRFFNVGEFDDPFDWSSYDAEHKEDGSCLVVYFYKKWRVNTLGSFGDSIVGKSDKTWGQWFWHLFEGQLEEPFVYLFEFCSHHNPVVVYHKKPTLRHTGTLLNGVDCNKDCGVEKPKTVHLQSRDEVVELLSVYEKEFGSQFEGFVLRDGKTRLKLKSLSYLAAHNRFDNRTVFQARKLVPIILEGEDGSLLLQLPYLKDRIEEVKNRLFVEKSNLLETFEQHRHLDAKSFAFVIGHHPLANILFRARHNTFESAWNTSGSLIAVKLFDE